mmetsp:Transcript_16124/g.41398  ORF Transcript_16124/g.41398 Transcript_16124/m.41398 type:complete len:240 (-) Transcript_16124:739-1458(-)
MCTMVSGRKVFLMAKVPSRLRVHLPASWVRSTWERSTVKVYSSMVLATLACWHALHHPLFPHPNPEAMEHYLFSHHEWRLVFQVAVQMRPYSWPLKKTAKSIHSMMATLHTMCLMVKESISLQTVVSTMASGSPDVVTARASIGAVTEMSTVDPGRKTVCLAPEPCATRMETPTKASGRRVVVMARESSFTSMKPVWTLGNTRENGMMATVMVREVLYIPLAFDILVAGSAPCITATGS